METTPRSFTNDDGIKHSFVLPKMTSKRVAEGIDEERIGTSYEWVKWKNDLLIGTINYFQTIFFPVENGGSSWNPWELLAVGERGQLEVKDEK